MFLFNKLRKVKFKKVANEWLEYKRNCVKESTYFNYMFIIEKYLNIKFADVNIKKISNYNDTIKELSHRLSPKTVRDIVNVLKAILKYYEEEHNCKLNYKKIGMPKLEKNSIEILSDKEKNKIENYCIKENTLKSLGIVICLNTGLRVGEICALKWKNIDLEERNIYVKENLQRVYNPKNRCSNIVIGRPKTESSIRCVPMNKKLFLILSNIKKKYELEAFFLTGSSSKFIEPRNYQNKFKHILRKCKVKPHKFHILRHTFATNCIEVGMDIKALSEILGHSNIEITLNIYVHPSRRRKNKYLEKI